MSALVIVERLAGDESSMERQFDSALERLNFVSEFQKARAVFIKPNLTYPSFKKGVTTQAAFVGHLISSFRRINKTTKVFVGEGEGGYNSFSMAETLHSMRFHEFASQWPNVEVVNLSCIPSRIVNLRGSDKDLEIRLPLLLLEEVDFSISCPVPKVHCMTTLSLSLKNLWGCLPDTMRLRNHYELDRLISQLCEKMRFRFAFLDGRFGLDGNGPIIGTPVDLDWFAASNSLAAHDMVLSEMMGMDWKRIGHIREAVAAGPFPDGSGVKVVVDALWPKRTFRLRRRFWDYPAWIAFRSKRLTYLFYLSRLSGLLHWFMYLFRKRPIP